MILEIKKEDKEAIEKIILKIAEENKIYYGFDFRADIISNKDKKEVTLKLNNIRI